LIEIKKAAEILPPPAPVTSLKKNTPVKNETRGKAITVKKGGKGSSSSSEDDPVAAARKAAREAQAQREKEIIEKATNAIINKKKEGKK
jgi:hypothetical protein